MATAMTTAPTVSATQRGSQKRGRRVPSNSIAMGGNNGKKRQLGKSTECRERPVCHERVRKVAPNDNGRGTPSQKVQVGWEGPTSGVLLRGAFLFSGLS